MLVIFLTISLIAGSIVAEQAVFARAALQRATLAVGDSATHAAIASLQTQLAAAIAACGVQAPDGSNACAALDRPDRNIQLQNPPAIRTTFVVHTTIVPNFSTTTCSSGAPAPQSATPVGLTDDAHNIQCSAFVHETRYAATIAIEVRAPDDVAVLQKRIAHVTLRLTLQAPYAYMTGLKEDGGDNPDFAIEGDVGGTTGSTQIGVGYACAGEQCVHAPGDPTTSVGVDGQKRAHFDWANDNANTSNWSL